MWRFTLKYHLEWPSLIPFWAASLLPWVYACECVCSVMLIRSASVHADNGGYFSWGINFCYFVLDSKFPPTKVSAFTVMLELACMEAIKARGMVKTIMEAWPTVQLAITSVTLLMYSTRVVHSPCYLFTFCIIILAWLIVCACIYHQTSYPLP